MRQDKSTRSQWINASALGMGTAALGINLIGGGSNAQAAAKYWDTNGTAAGSGTATGTWGTSTFWATADGGNLSTSGWSAGSDAFFSASSDTGPANVTTSAQTANSINIQQTGPLTLSSGGLLTISGQFSSTVISVATNAAAVTFNGGVAIGNATNTTYAISNKSSNVLTFGGTVSSALAVASTVTLNVSGTGTGGTTFNGVVTNNNGVSTRVTALLVSAANSDTTLTNASNSYTGSTTIQAGRLVAGTDSPSGANGAFGSASSALVLGNGSTGANDAPSVLMNGAYTVGRAITVGSVANTAAYNATIGGTNTSGTSTYTGNVTLNTTASNYTTTLQAATGGVVEFKTGTWTTNNKAIAVGSSGNLGTVRLSNNIATSGGIGVNYGTLALNSAFTGGNVTVASGATLGGIGSVAGNVTINGTGILAPGNSPGILSVGGDVTLSGSSTYAVDLDGLTAGNGSGFYDQLQLTGTTGTINLNSATLTPTFSTFAPAPAGGDMLFIVNNLNSGRTVSGTFAGLADDAFVTNYNGQQWYITYDANAQGTPSLDGGNDIALYSAVPEPTMLGMIGVSVIGMASRRRRAN